MRIQDFMKLVGQPGRENFFVVCPDNLGLNLLLQRVLEPIANAEDVHFYAAESLTKENARDLEKEARMASRGSSAHTHFFIHGLQKLAKESAGPLLKAVEEARYARFILQAQWVPQKVLTLMSRCTVCRIPFMSKKMVLGNLKAMNHDAKTADNLNLYDGTLEGTIQALRMKDTLLAIQRDLKKGVRGLTSVMAQDVLNSLAFDVAAQPFLSARERAYVRRMPDNHNRKKIALFLASERVG